MSCILILGKLTGPVAGTARSMSVEEALPTPVTFPRMFPPALTDDGFISAPDRRVLVKSVPHLAQLSTTFRLRNYFGRVTKQLRSLDLGVAAKLRGITSDEYECVRNDWSSLEEDYTWRS